MLHFITFLHPANNEWVTFIHGAGGSSSIWYKQIRDFKAQFNVLLIDLRGHGMSKKPIYEKLKEYTFEVIGDEVIEVLDHLAILKSHFVGISLGTIIIRDLCERYPARMQSLILGGAVMKLNVRGQFLMRLGDLLKSVLPYVILYRFFAFIIMPRKKHRESRNLFIREAQHLYQKEFKRWFTLVAEINPLLKFFRFKDSGVPTLYIMGSEDHMFLPSISKLVEYHAMSTLHVIPACGHVVNVEQPQEFNRIALSFLTEGLRSR
ncbi:MAG: alpha/beta hydrolase [Bacteroidota bacterium]|nr:alpha/beta hydrolase [Bacteroidota bacterium]MDX5430921.1 alpha/beta hydrolase [Bacteroidota bacterium]MDX5469668.1 alpha/beta hydrolase [Bacteroidota bacterium]